MRIAFVTYGPGDMAHSPLLCKRFFVDHQLVFKEMKDSPGKLGFGQANTGGDKGMAALEAHVAALEVRIICLADHSYIISEHYSYSTSCMKPARPGKVV